ncbi:MAG: VWA domain-containing protein [Planctomycetes bacterium]|nr:VWA domain-containing protein [Planctomycetota bacterium]
MPGTLRPKGSAPRTTLGILCGKNLLRLVEGRVATVGSNPHSDLCLHHESVAPTHARFTQRGGVLGVEGLDPTRPIRVDGEARTTAVLHPGARVRIGEITLEIVDTTARDRARRGLLGRIALTVTPTFLEADPYLVPFRELHRTPNFAELMRHELRHTPWLVVSLLVHALIFLALVWLLPADAGRAGMLAPSYIGKELEPGPYPDDPLREETLTIPAEQIVEYDPLADPVVSQAPFDPRIHEPQGAKGFDSDADPGLLLLRLPGMGAKGGERSGIRDILELGGDALKRSGFKSTVAAVRRSGLEIVFVVDSTGSMSSVIEAARQRLARMLDVLRALVPDARIGVVTYRDHGRDEQYLTRAVALSRDYYRAVNFVHTLLAAGGGDREEAVLEALQVAVQQPWRPNARRVVVLIGDAPAHSSSLAAIQKLVRAFAADGRSHLHAIVTPGDDRERVPGDTLASFGRIATSGRGRAVPLEDEATVLKQVLSLAFGTEYRRDLEEVYRLVEAEQRRIDRQIGDVVFRGDLTRLQRELARDPVPPEVVHALLASPRARTAQILVEMLKRKDLPEPGRQAAGYVLMRMLDLPLPPVDPVRGGPIDAEQERELLTRIRRRF